MKIYTPDYYASFHCIADRCRRSCCIGWEIDIDSHALAYYRSVGGVLGERLSANIEVTEEGAFFRLDAHERCPFLNTNGLCDLITELGENALCEICAEHPRFRNFFDSRTEVGLGLCCEEAARLILTHEEKTELIPLSDDGEGCASTPEEEAFFTFREHLFALLQDRSISIWERLKCTLESVGVSQEAIFANDDRWAAVYRSLEQLDPAWSDRLTAWQAQTAPIATVPDTPEISLALEQLAVYFIFRHLADSLFDGRREARVAFAILSCHIIAGLAALEDSTLSSIIDIARSYSAEIEYSTENVEVLLDELQKYIS